jgi:hypothetical protein
MNTNNYNITLNFLALGGLCVLIAIVWKIGHAVIFNVSSSPREVAGDKTPVSLKVTNRRPVWMSFLDPSFVSGILMGVFYAGYLYFVFSGDDFVNHMGNFWFLLCCMLLGVIFSLGICAIKLAIRKITPYRSPEESASTAGGEG